MINEYRERTEILERDRNATFTSEGPIEFSRLTLGIDTWCETGLLSCKKIRLNFVTPHSSAGILMTPSRVHSCSKHPLSLFLFLPCLSRRDPLIYTLKTTHLKPYLLARSAISPAFRPATPSPLPPLTFCRRWLLSRSAH